MIVDALKMLKTVMDNPVSRNVLRMGLKACQDCHVKEIEHALAIFAGEDTPHNVSCHLYSWMVSAILMVSGSFFDVDFEKLRGYFKDPIVRRGVVSVLSGIGRRGVTKPQFLDAPFLVVWNYTNACNLRCKHCYQRAERPGPNELSTREKLRVVSDLAEAGVVSIAFSGGEPLMSRDFYRVAAEAKKRGMYIALATNGTLISPSVARRLKKCGVEYVEVSLDAATPEVHDGFRGIAGSFEKTMRGIKNCVEEGFFTCIATTVTKLNLQEVPRLVRLARNVGAKRFITFNFIPVGRAENISDLDLTPDQREELLRLLFRKSREDGIEILSTAPQFARVCLAMSEGRAVAPTHFYVGQASWDLHVLAEFIGGCGAGRLYGALQPNGDVTPCVFMPDLVVGNVRERTFSDIWHNSEVMWKLRNRELLKGHCGQCEYKYVCGGCRARALGYFGDVLAPDPGCVNNKEFYMRYLTGRRKDEALRSNIDLHDFAILQHLRSP
ncbi:MAG: radical SAM protein [Candidatus Bathyarchaeia archaeon]